MSSSEATFPARFAELVYLIAHQPDSVVEQENVLGAAVAAIASGDASLTTSQLNVDLLDEGQTADAVQLHELVMRMSAHSAHQIDFLSRVPPYEILGVAQILAGEARPNDDGAAFDDKLVKLGPTCIEVHLGRSGFVRTGGLTPTSLPTVSPRTRTPTPFRAMPAFVGRTPPSNTAIPAGPVNATRSTPVRAASVTPIGNGLIIGASLAAEMTDVRHLPSVPAIRDESLRIIEGAFHSKSLASLSDDELIEQLRAGLTHQNAMRLLDELVGVAEQRAEEQRWEVVARVFDAFVRGETAAEHNAELRRAYTIAIRRLTKSTLLRGIAGLLPRRPELRDGLQDVMIRLGPEAAEALIDLLTTADSLTDRRAYLAALAILGPRVRALQRQ